MKVLLIDNFDSFTGNIYDALRKHGADVKVSPPTLIDDKAYDRIVIGPGPGEPRDVQVLQNQIPHLQTPVLGICLGHQLIAAAYGAAIIRARRPMHGKKSLIEHKFMSFPAELAVARYHSLIVKPDTIPTHLKLVAWTKEGEPMAIKHIEKKMTGIQFHPDSIFTDHGPQFFKEFLDHGEILC